MNLPGELVNLPIYPFLDGIADSLLSSASGFLVLTAQTAAGKSTAVPLALLDRVPGTILVLEPRRVAAVAIANRLAELLGERPGQTAGYRLHLESRVSPQTRIEVITEAILTRRLQADPSLAGVSIVILDEFHERSVHADLALAFLRESMGLRDDLRVLVMSATIDADRISRYLDADVVEIPGRSWPVDIEYLPSAADRYGRLPHVSERCARAVKTELGKPGGDILVFLPGIAEIRRAEGLLEGLEAEILILHSSIPFESQKKVLEGGASRRRVILSSSIAETSLTVPGVTVVIDSGLSRVGRFDIPTGMYTLVTGTESVFSAAQRAGRSGRTAPGRCVRLWAEHDARLSETPPEILRTDMVQVVLECALWGVREIGGLSWLDPPNRGAWDTARELLTGMEALDSDGHVTERGRRISGLGVHPRIAAVALSGDIDCAVDHARVAGGPQESDRLRKDLARRIASLVPRDGGTKAQKKAPIAPVAPAPGRAMSLLAGFPDRIAAHRGDGIYQFPSGRLAALPREVRAGCARPSEWIVAPDVDAGEREGLIRSFEAIETGFAEEWLERHAKTETSVFFADGAYRPGSKIRKIERRAYGKLILRERPLTPSDGDVAAAICQAVRTGGIKALPSSDAIASFMMRASFRQGRAGKTGASIPSARYDEASLIDDLESWLLPFIPADGRLDADTVLSALRYRCDGQGVDREVPVRITLENGVNRPVSYEILDERQGVIPVMETRIQDLYGCRTTPEILGIPVLLRLLSPARRPVQITRDLAGFWKKTWPEVRKEMKGRYPKHRWPEDPLSPETKD